LRTNIKGIFELARYVSIELEYLANKFGLPNQNFQGGDAEDPTINPSKVVFDYVRKIESQLTYISESVEEETLIRKSPLSVYFSAIRKFQTKVKQMEKNNKK
jgi:hypothetical protein